TLMKLGSRVLGFPPFVSLLLAGIFGIPTWLIIREVAGAEGWINWPGFSGSIAFWFILFSVGYTVCIQVLWLVLKVLFSLIALSIAGVDYDDNRVLKYSPILLLIIACAIAMPLMAVTAKEMVFSTVQFYLSLFLSSVVVFVILMFACSELNTKRMEAAATAEATGPRQGGGEPSEGRWFPTLGIILGALKQKACPIIQQDAEVEPDPEE
ncbi:MAG: hypothetical protein NTV06_00530, partial [candidate division Zixibacteria bacterium]|nr:hypothetical protein [candidate division Zixibacteria bacterium]